MRPDAAEFTIKRRHHSGCVFPAFVVAIPARNEKDVVAACLRSLQSQAGDARLGVLCFVNNSDDATFDTACAQADRHATPVRVVDAAMAPEARNAGGARRAAMDLAAEWLDEGGHRDGLLLTTDADSEPATDWVMRIRAALALGADAVAGTIELYPKDAVALPDHLHARGALEARYDALLTEMFARLDPRPHDPWPCHATNAGANLAVTLVAYRAIGGLPLQACGEDKALVARLDRRGFRVRHDPAVRVLTSGRLIGRAAGGVAETIRLRCEQPDAFCDNYLEPARTAWFRGLWRGRLRRIFTERGRVAAALAFGGLPARASPDDMFGAFWEALESGDIRLARARLRPSDLPREIDAAEAMVRDLRRSMSVVRKDRADSPQFVPAG